MVYARTPIGGGMSGARTSQMLCQRVMDAGNAPAQPDYTGPLVARLGGADISWLVGWVVSAGLYLALSARTARASRYTTAAGLLTGGR